MGPLSGLRVLDLSRVVAGPHAAKMLLDMGADVIKVEPPDGDLTRFQFPKVGSMSTYFVQQNVGKRNISLDLRRPEAVDIVRRLALRSDVLIENFRPGVLERLGLGADQLLREHPRLIYASVSGYGLDGPWVDRRAYAPMVAAETGLTKSQGDGRRSDVYVNDHHSHTDVYAGIELGVAILAALYQREQTGSGQRVHVSLAQVQLYVNEHVHNDLFDGPVDPNWIRSFGASDFPIVTLADGSNAIIGGHPAEKYAFGVYAAMMGRPDLVDDARFATPADRLANMAELTQLIRDWARTVPDVQTLEARFEAHSLAVGALRSVRELAESEWAKFSGAIVAVPDRSGGSVRIPEAPWRFSAGEAHVGGEPRFRGEDNRSVLAELGFDDAAIGELERDGVLSSRVPDTARPTGRA